MFSFPKGGDIWKSATKGSTGGWAKPFAKPAALLPAAAALAAIPVTGGLSAAWLPQLAALGLTAGAVGGIQGATTGIWGKPGTGSALRGAGMGALQGAGVSGLGQMVGGLTGAGSTAAASAANNAAYLSPAGYGYTPSLGSMAAGSSGALGNAAMGSALGMGSAASGLPAMYGAGLGGVAAGGTAAASSPNWIQSLFGLGGGAANTAKTAGSGINLGQTAAGLGISALPSLFSQTPQAELSPMYGDITSRLLGGKGISDIGNLSREKLMGQLNEPYSSAPDEYYNASTRRLDEAYDKAEKDYAAQYQGLRPGANVESDSGYREGLSKLKQDRSREKSAIAADLDYRRENEYLARQTQSIQQALGVDQQTMQDYMALAQMDTERIALNTGISYGEAEQFKNIFGQLGSAFMQRGLGLDAESSLQRLMSAVGR